MKKILALAVLLLPNIAIAQERDYTLKLSSKDVNYIYSKLTEQPFKDVFGIISKIQSQVTYQNQEQTKPVQVEPKKDGE